MTLPKTRYNFLFPPVTGVYLAKIRCIGMNGQAYDVYISKLGVEMLPASTSPEESPASVPSSTSAGRSAVMYIFGMSGGRP
jgi:hypothetical protein